MAAGGDQAAGRNEGSCRLLMDRMHRGGMLLGPWLVLLALFAVGCSSLPPVRAFRAARYYADGTRALERGDAQVAIAELERAVALMPLASEIHNHLGLAYWSDERDDAALRELERAVELDCDNEEARVNLARLRAARAPVVTERSDSNGG